MVIPYLTFRGECAAALRFYAAAFDTVIEGMQPYGSYVPEGISAPEGLADWVLHAQMTVAGQTCWFADEAAAQVTRGNAVKLTVSVPEAAQAARIYACLGEGASITLPPTETFYSAFHAGLVDRFGVSWNIVAEEAPKGAAQG